MSGTSATFSAGGDFHLSSGTPAGFFRSDDERYIVPHDVNFHSYDTSTSRLAPSSPSIRFPLDVNDDSGRWCSTAKDSLQSTYLDDTDSLMNLFPTDEIEAIYSNNSVIIRDEPRHSSLIAPCAGDETFHSPVQPTAPPLTSPLRAINDDLDLDALAQGIASEQEETPPLSSFLGSPPSSDVERGEFQDEYRECENPLRDFSITREPCNSPEQSRFRSIDELWRYVEIGQQDDIISTFPDNRNIEGGLQSINNVPQSYNETDYSLPWALANPAAQLHHLTFPDNYLQRQQAQSRGLSDGIVNGGSGQVSAMPSPSFHNPRASEAYELGFGTPPESIGVCPSVRLLQPIPLLPHHICASEAELQGNVRGEEIPAIGTLIHTAKMGRNSHVSIGGEIEHVENPSLQQWQTDNTSVQPRVSLVDEINANQARFNDYCLRLVFNRIPSVPRNDMPSMTSAQQARLFVCMQKTADNNRGYGPFVPQRVYKSNQGSTLLMEPIVFHVKGALEPGIPLNQALSPTLLNIHKERLAHGEEQAFKQSVKKVTFRIEWPGYCSYSQQLPTWDWVAPPHPITMSKLTTDIARKVDKFIKHIVKTGTKCSEERWKVGGSGIGCEKLIIVSLHQMARGSWQPQLRLNQCLWPSNDAMTQS